MRIFFIIMRTILCSPHLASVVDDILRHCVSSSLLCSVMLHAREGRASGQIFFIDSKYILDQLRCYLWPVFMLSLERAELTWW